jgi:hypothetical protein
VAYLNGGGTSFTGTPNCDASAQKVNGSIQYFPQDGYLDANGLAKYSCISVNSSPQEVNYDIAAGHSIAVKLNPGSTPTAVHVGWDNSSNSSAATTLGTCSATDKCSTPQADTVSPNATGALRIGIYPIVASCSGGAHNYTLITDSENAKYECAARNYVLFPSSNNTVAPSGVDFGALANGSFISTACALNSKPSTTYNAQATPHFCYQKINNLTSTNPTNTVYIRLTALYRDLKVTIELANGAGGNTTLTLPDAEGVVDATGVGNDVLRRIKAYVPRANDTYSIQSMDSVCKLFKMNLDDTLSNYTGVDNGAAGGDAACKAPTRGGPTGP